MVHRIGARRCAVLGVACLLEFDPPAVVLALVVRGTDVLAFESESATVEGEFKVRLAVGVGPDEVGDASGGLASGQFLKQKILRQLAFRVNGRPMSSAVALSFSSSGCLKKAKSCLIGTPRAAATS